MLRGYYILLLIFMTIMPLISIWGPRLLGVVPLIIGGIGWGVFFLQETRPRLNKNYLAIFCLILLWAFLGSLWSPEPYTVIERAIKLLAFVIGGSGLWAGAFVLPVSYRHRILRFLPWSIGLAALLTIFEYAQNYPIYRMIKDIDEGARIKPVVTNRTTSFQVLMFWPACLVLASGRYAKTFMCILAAIILSLNIYIFSTQAAFLAIFAGLAVFLIAQVKSIRQYLVQGFFAVCGILTLFAPGIAWALYKWQPDFVQSWQVAAVPQRITIWHATYLEIRERPLIGYGLRATRTLDEKIRAHIAPYTWPEIFHPHNFTLQIWIEMGVIGVGLFLGLWYFIYKDVKKQAGHHIPYILAVITAILGVSATGYGLWQSWWLGSIIIASFATALWCSVHKDKGET